ncbi:TPA: hypothetical protein ACOVJJ_004471 [Klebsiella oxytoca]
MDEQIALYERSVAAYEGYLRVINNKYQAGSESWATQAQREHAIALLIVALDGSWG